MDDAQSIFSEEWRACLRAHYLYVVRIGDQVTEPTLRQVLYQTGLTDEELAYLRALALDMSPEEVLAPEEDLAADGPEAGVETDDVEVDIEADEALSPDADDWIEDEDADWPADDAEDVAPDTGGQLSLF